MIHPAPMIDCHAHAFPNTGSWLQRLVPADQLDSVLEPTRRITGPVTEHLSDASTAVNLTIETLAAFRRQSTHCYTGSRSSSSGWASAGRCSCVAPWAVYRRP